MRSTSNTVATTAHTIACDFPKFDPGWVWLVGAGPGDAGLLTLNGLHALRQADIVIHDALVGEEILSFAREGVELVYQKLFNTLKQKGLQAMETTGQTFNPELHEALSEIPVPSEDMKGKIIDTIEKGYYLNDRIIRYAKVVVGK